MAVDSYLFDVRLVGFPGVTRRVAVRADQTLEDLHAVLQDAFEWDDDHLYSFWLGGELWAQDGSEYTSPIDAGPDDRTADVRLDGLGLGVGQKIAYVFDFGDEWRVRLRLKETAPADGDAYPRIVASRGPAPPQYLDDEELDEAV